jgi:hypothetical protein
MRLAGESDQKKAYKHADLPPLQHRILLEILRGRLRDDEFGAHDNEIASAINESIAKTQRELRLLKKAEMATDGDDIQATFGLGTEWWFLEKGEEYLDERGLL